MPRRILSGVIVILCAGTALAQLSTENTAPDAASNAPVAFVYVSRWDEKARLRRDALSSQVIDAL